MKKTKKQNELPARSTRKFAELPTQETMIDVIDNTLQAYRLNLRIDRLERDRGHENISEPPKMNKFELMDSLMNVMGFPDTDKGCYGVFKKAFINYVNDPRITTKDAAVKFYKTRQTLLSAKSAEWDKRWLAFKELNLDTATTYTDLLELISAAE